MEETIGSDVMFVGIYNKQKHPLKNLCHMLSPSEYHERINSTSDFQMIYSRSGVEHNSYPMRALTLHKKLQESRSTNQTSYRCNSGISETNVLFEVLIIQYQCTLIFFRKKKCTLILDRSTHLHPCTR
jgi:hypothetical protein